MTVQDRVIPLSNLGLLGCKAIKYDIIKRFVLCLFGSKTRQVKAVSSKNLDTWYTINDHEATLEQEQEVLNDTDHKASKELL